jgi:protein-disulfide isomerase
MLKPESIGASQSWQYARTAGVLDSASYVLCMASGEAHASLARDTADGRRLGVVGTPTLLIRGTRVDGLPPMDSLVAYVRRAAEEGRAAKRKR